MIKGYERALNLFDMAPKISAEKLRDIIQKDSILLATHMRDDIMTGGTSANKLAVRSGKMRTSTRAAKPRMTATKISGGVVFGTNYATTHVGEKGSKKVINKKSKMLTIPLDAMRTKSGVSRGPAGGSWVKSHYEDTFIKKSKAGNLIIFGKNKNKITPLFVLKEQVKIPARIHPSELIEWIESRIIRDAISEGKNVFSN